MGASVATAFAAMYHELVGGLVLEDPPWLDTVKTPEEKSISANKFLAFLSEFKAYSSSEIIEKPDKFTLIGTKLNICNGLMGCTWSAQTVPNGF